MTSKKNLQLSKDELKKLHERAVKHFDAAQKNNEHNENAGREDLKFAAADQWTKESKASRGKRPIITINNMGKFIRQVTNDIRQARQAIRVRGVDDKADPKTAKVYTGQIRHIELVSDAQASYIWGVQSAATCGTGSWRVVTEYAEDDVFDQDIYIRRIIDPYSVYWDANASHPLFLDAEHCFVTDLLTKDAAKKRYKNITIQDFDNHQKSTTVSTSSHWIKDDMVRIGEYWYVDKIEKEIALLSDGSVVDTNNVPNGLQVIDTRITHSRKIYQCHMSGNEVLEGPFAWAGRYIPIITISGEEIYDGERVVKKGLVRDAKDAQRAYNYARSAITESIGASPKAPWLLSGKMIKGLEKHWEEANEGNPAYLLYNEDPNNPALRPTRQEPITVQPALLQEVAQAAEDMKATTGIFDAALGMRSNETSGKAILARQREGDIGTAHYSDNLSRGIAHTGTILVDLIPKIFDGPRTSRIIGDDGAEGTVKLNQPFMDQDGVMQPPIDLTVGKYDVVVDTGPSYTTKRQEASESMIAYMQIYPAAAPWLGDLFAKAQDWPDKEIIAERMKKMLPPQLMDQPPQPAGPPQPSPMEVAAHNKLQEEIEGKRLDNVKKAMELLKQDGQFEMLIKETMMQNLQQIMAGMQPMQPPSIPAQAGDPTGGNPMPGFNPIPQ